MNSVYATVIGLVVAMGALHLACEAHMHGPKTGGGDNESDEPKVDPHIVTEEPPPTKPPRYATVQRATSHCLQKVYADVPMVFQVKGVCAVMSCLVTYDESVKLANVDPMYCVKVKKPCKQSRKAKLKPFPKCCPRECDKGTVARSATRLFQ